MKNHNYMIGNKPKTQAGPNNSRVLKLKKRRRFRSTFPIMDLSHVEENQTETGSGN